MRFVRCGRALLLLVLTGCPAQSPPATEQTYSVTDALVVEVEGDDGVHALRVAFDASRAAPGEYFAFASATPDVVVADASTFDPASCSGDCDVPHLGRYQGSEVLSSNSSLQLQGVRASAGRFYAVLVRRGPPAAPFTVKVTASNDHGGGGCGAGDGPTLTRR